MNLGKAYRRAKLYFIGQVIGIHVYFEQKTRCVCETHAVLNAPVDSKSDWIFS